MTLDWNQLLENSPAFSICLTWEWLFTWWNNFCTDEFELQILLLRDGDKLIGIAPFVLHTSNYLGLFPLCVLRFLGTGEPESESVVSEYLDVIAQSGEQSRVANALWMHLRQSGTSGLWDQIVLNDALVDSLVMTELRRSFTEGRSPSQLDCVGIRYWLDLPRNVDEYANLLDPGVARRFAYKRRKLERAGHVEFSRVTAESDLKPKSNVERIW